MENEVVSRWSDPEVLIATVLYSFVLASYEGDEPIRPLSVINSELLIGCNSFTIQQAFDECKKFGYVSLHPEKVGWIALEDKGKWQLESLRDEFYDSDVLDAIHSRIIRIDKCNFNQSAQQLGAVRTVTLTAQPGQACPKAGLWFAPHLKMRELRLRQGESMPVQQVSETGSVIWYFKGE